MTIEHRAVYRFAGAQAGLVQALRLTPPTSDDQTVVRWRIDVDRDARMRPGRDGFGNAVTMLYVDAPLDRLAIEVTGEVLTSNAHGVLRGATEQLPPALFLRATEATPADPAIAAFAHAVAAELEPLAALHAVNAAVHERFVVAPVGDASRPLAEAFADGTVDPVEATHIFLVAARSLGRPARYVSGYRQADGETVASPHGWAEAYVEGIGWIGFDPLLGRSPEEAHVRLATALDAGGASPVAGVPVEEA
ncbi:transglutaminase family protein [Sphingomonas abaci]|uniref:Transglutaminase-like putative cysteine protease n=1 Tax=Sphingomonas abaci TaxID=237611 RepID=A0A7W7EXN6_9SPHN|nr:transglutaminase N-terminal domain-containing protein [Sphingomonas abaci]MBB4617807.1 transglutaminase-like putative cysteine protease [Sphingomonas abaci]